MGKFSQEFFEWLFKNMYKSSIKKQSAKGAQLDWTPKRTKAGPNIPPLYSYRKPETDIHGTLSSVVREAPLREGGYVGPSLSKVRETKYKDVTDYSKTKQLELFNEKKDLYEKVLKAEREK